MKIIKSEMERVKGEELLTVYWEPNWFERLFGAKPYEAQYIGECTVWHTYPWFRRCDVFLENKLASLWHKHRFERKMA